MKPTKLILCLVAALSTQAMAGPRPVGSEPEGEGHRIPIHGQWDEWNPNEFRTDAVLDRDHSYTITNNTKDLIYVWLVEADQTPCVYFPLGAGQSQQFGTPWNLSGETYTLDLFLDSESKVNGNSFVLREGTEIVTD